MGYACPVCEDPQADAGHLANHVAFTAILGDDAHGTWLDEHVPGWGEMDEAELADALRGSVEETEFPQVFEDTVGGLSESDVSPAERSGGLFDDGSSGEGHDQDHDHGYDHDHGHHDQLDGATSAVDVPDVAGVDPAGPTDEETAAILEEAREMTREKLGVEGESQSGERVTQEGECEGGGDDDGADTGTDADIDADADAAEDVDGNENE